MAFTVTARHSGNNGTTSAQTLATNSTTPTANSLLLVGVGCENQQHGGTQAHQTPTGGSLVYTLVDETASVPWATTGTDYAAKASLWQAEVGGSPSAHTITADAYAGTEQGWYGVVACDITGHDATSPIVQSVDDALTKPGGNSESGTVTLPATPTAGNLLVVLFYATADSGGGFASPTAGSGKTMNELFNQNTGYSQAGLWYRVCDGTESATITCSDLGQAVGSFNAIAVEIRLASVPGLAPLGWIAGINT